MSTHHSTANGYSADVRMHLSIDGRTIGIRQMGPDFVILQDSLEVPPTQGEISMSIDGRVKQWTVTLPDGICSNRIRTRVARLG